MKKLFVLTALLISTAFGSNIYAQQTPPPGAGSKDLRDTDVKRRSIEMERVDREAKKASPAQAKTTVDIVEDKLAVKYAEIKTDYEQIQLSQDAIVKTYQGTGKIDYSQIGKSALEINSSANRLKSNLFPAEPSENANSKTEEKNKDKIEQDAKSTKSVRDLIVDLDNSIGSFATSPMFQNLRIVDAGVSEKAKLDLEKIINLSAALNSEVRKMIIAK